MHNEPLYSVYQDLEAIRVRSAWHILRALRRSDGERCVLVVPGRRADVAAAGAALASVQRAHDAIRHDAVPAVSARRTLAGRPVLEFACDAVADGIQVTSLLGRAGLKIPYAAGDAFVVGIRKALQAAHRAAPEPLCLGRLSGANVLFDASGRWRIVGFGANFPVEDARGMPDGELPYFQAPELAIGGRASPAGDYLALMLFMRSVVCHIDSAGVLGAVLKAGFEARDSVLSEALRWVEQRIVGALPSQRASVEEAVTQAERIRSLLGVSLDPRGFERVVERALATPPDDHDDAALRVNSDASWIAVGRDAPQPLRGAARRIVQALVEHHLFAAQAPLRSVELMELGWPDERPEYEAGLNRVYVTMNRLRRQLPDGALQRFDDGYRLAPELDVRRVAL